jgi:hypothetical protein
MSLWQKLFGPAKPPKPPKEQARDRAVAWWQQKGATSAKCDVCNDQVSAKEGYLLRTADMLQSDSYVKLCCEKMAKDVIRSSSIPGIDSVVMGAVMPAASFAVRDKVIGRIKSVRTPWLVCERCLQRHFEKIATTT